ncbi:MAG: Rieske (2Fe-2S) protein [Pseudomonadota bacterium]
MAEISEMATSDEVPMGEEFSVGPVEDFPVGELRLVTARNREIGVLRRSDDTIHAVRNWCPHKGAPICKVQPTGTALPGPPGTLTWGMEGEILRCPWHGFEFHIKTGERPFTDSRMRLRVYPARIADGEVLIDLGPRRAQEQAQ